jgi:hypothetical protein
MPANRAIVICFYRKDGHRERIPLPHGTLAEAVMGIQRVFHISDALYTKAEIRRDGELVETMENRSALRGESILIQ